MRPVDVEYLPARQSRHTVSTVAAREVEYLPSLQSIQVLTDVASTVVLYLPATHARQDEELIPEYVPAEQELHEICPDWA